MHYDAFDKFNNKAYARVSLNDFLCESDDILNQHKHSFQNCMVGMSIQESGTYTYIKQIHVQIVSIHSS